MTWSIYRSRDPGPRRVPLDSVGLGLLVLWVGALQIMIDKGKELDWFASTQIVLLAVTALVAFLFFLVWELTETHPIVNLRLFARRNFLMGTAALSIAYGLFFGNVVLLPLWLQQYMGYTATWAGMAMAPVGLLAILLSPLVGKNVGRIDPRRLATVAFLIFGLVLWMRSQFQHPGDIRCGADPDADPGRGDGVLLHPAAGDHLQRAAARRDAGRVGAEQFRAHHRRRLRHLAVHDAVGKPRRDAPRAPGRGDRLRQRRSRRRRWRNCSAAGYSAEQAAASDQSADRPAGLYDGGDRRVLPVVGAVHRADRPGLAAARRPQRGAAAADAGAAH